MPNISSGDVEEIVAADDIEEVVVELIDGVEARLADTETAVAEAGQQFFPGDNIRLRPAKDVSKVLRAVGGDLTYRVKHMGVPEPNVAGGREDRDYVEADRATFRAATRNRPGIVGDSITPGAGGDTFADQTVPNGFNVVVQNQHSSDNVFVQDDGGTDLHRIGPGGSFTIAVQNLNQISITGTANNPTVTATVEAP